MTRANWATGLQAAVLLGLVAVWEILPRAGIVPEFFLPPFTKALGAIVSNSGELATHTLSTLWKVVVSLLLACGGGIIVGAAIGSVALLRSVLLPVFSSLFAIPIIIIYPLMTAWFGIDAQSKIIFASVHGFIPVVLQTAAGVQNIDSRLIVAGRSMGASRLQLLYRIILPAAVPTILSSVKLGGIMCLVGVIVAEMMVSARGLGFLITKYRTMLESSGVYAAVLLVLLLVVLYTYLIQKLERYVAGDRVQKGSGLG